MGRRSATPGRSGPATRAMPKPVARAYSTRMGRDIEAVRYTREQRQRYRDKVKVCLDVFEQMLATSSFAFDEPKIGMEIELNLVASDYRPRLDNDEVLTAIANPEYQTEL